jgi:hypothetical protein
MKASISAILEFYLQLPEKFILCFLFQFLQAKSRGLTINQILDLIRPFY